MLHFQNSVFHPKPCSLVKAFRRALMSLGPKTLFYPNNRGDVGAGSSPARFIQEGLCSGDGGLDTDELVTSR